MENIFNTDSAKAASEECKLFNNGHKYVYDVYKSDKEIMVFSCVCGHILNEFEDSPAGC